MPLSKNLHQLMKIHGNLSVSDLAKITHIPQPTLHHILCGSTKRPRIKALEALANFFSISLEQLVGNTPLPSIIPEIVKENLQIRTIPIVPWAMIKEWPISNAKHLHLKEVILEKKVTENSFALILEDSSMEPLLPKNALLIFDFGKNPADRDIAIVQLGSDNTILFNRIFIDNTDSYIKQNMQDGNVKLIKLNLEVDRILGTLIEVRIQF